MKMKQLSLKHIIRPLAMTAASIAAVGQIAAAPKVTAQLDSSYIVMGRQVNLTLEALMPESAKNFEVLLPRDTITDKVEIIAVHADTSSAGSGMKMLRQQILLQSFDSGLYAIPPVRVVIDGDTALSNHTILKVIPVNVDSLQGHIHEYEGVAEPPHSIFDVFSNSFIRWFCWIVGILLLLGAAYAVYYYYFSKRRREKKAAPVIVPPYEEAREALNRLQQEHLCEQGQEREFYTRLTDILRVYLDRRFGISAMEMTSSEILRALSDNQETRWSRSEIQQVLNMADFVKFAKMRPLPDDNIKTFRTVEEFVEATKPKPQPEPAAEGTQPVADAPTTSPKSK